MSDLCYLLLRLPCHWTAVVSAKLHRPARVSAASAAPAKSAPVVVDMDTDFVTDPAAAHWQDILQLAFPHLDLADIWCLSLTSQAAGKFVVDRLADGNYQHARDLLFSAVAAETCMHAQTCAGRQQLTVQAAVDWLLDAEVIPPELLALDSTRYLCLSGASHRKDLLFAGLEITYEAVVTAARKLTRYLYEWIEDCEACDINLQINHITLAACYSDEMEMDSNFLSTPDIILDHLYIALNIIGSLNPVVDGNACTNIIDLCSLPAAAEITAEAIEAFLHAAVQVFGTRGCSTIDHCEIRAVEALCRLDATNRLSHAAVCDLLKAAAETLPTNEMMPLFQLPAVRDLAPAQKVDVIVTLSRALVAADSTRDGVSFAIFGNILDELVPGIPEASHASLFKALFSLGTKDTTGDHRAALVAVGVMNAPGMKDFSTAVLVELLQYVLERGAKDPRPPETAVAFFLQILHTCPAAAELGMEGAAQLLQLARTLSYSSETLNELVQLQALQRGAVSDVPDSEV